MFIRISNLILFNNIASQVNRDFQGKEFSRRATIRNAYLSQTKEDGPLCSIECGLPFAKLTFDITDLAHITALDNFLKGSDGHYLVNSPPTLLIPTKDNCCGKLVTVARLGTQGKLFSKTGTSPMRVFQAKCRDCSSKFFPGYEEKITNGEVIRTYYKDRPKYFLLTTESAFDEELLYEVTDTITIAKTQFSQIAKIYNRSVGENDKLGNDVLIHAYLVWNITRRLPGHELIITRTDQRNIDVEALCKQALPNYQNTLDVWKKHRCEEKGCRARVAIIDMDAKTKRAVCQAPVENVTPSNESEINLIKTCINNPARGKGIGFCDAHGGASTDKASTGPTSEQLDIRPSTRLWRKEMQDQNKMPKDDLADGDGLCDHDGCRSADKIEKVFQTTAGLLYIVRPCLVRLRVNEVYRAESLSQWSICLVDCFGEEPDPDDLCYFCGDRVCEFEPFLKKRAQKGNTVFQNYLRLLDDKFVLDTFHGDKHTKKKCLPVGDEALYNSRLPKFAHIYGSNYEAAENTFRFINQFKSSSNFMTYAKRLIALLTIDDENNTLLEEEMEAKDQLLVSASKLQLWRKEDKKIREEHRK